MKLSEFFHPGEVRRDAEFEVTLHPKAARSNAVCYALNEAVLLKVNRNPYVSAVITTEELASLVDIRKGAAVVSNPRESYYRLHNHLFRAGLMRPHAMHAIDTTAEIASSVIIGQNVVIEAGVVIRHGAIIEENSWIGAGTYIGESAVLGARGMQNTKVNGKFFKVEWAGGVRIGRDCEVLACAVIQRPYHCEYTEVGDEARVSVKVNVGHGVRIGARTMIAGNSQLAGNAWIGSDAWIGQSCTICDGVRIGDRAEVKMGSVVVKNVPDGGSVSGNFAIPHERHIQEFIRRTV